MEPFIVLLLIFLAIIVIVVVFTVLLIIMSKNMSGGVRKRVVLDLMKWLTHRRIITYRPHQDFLTGDWMRATQNQKTALVREKGILKKPEHEINLEDWSIMQDSETGFTLIINGISVLSKELGNKLCKLRTELDKEKSEKSVLLARNKYLEKHMDKEIMKKLTTMVDNEVKLKSWISEKRK
jgi:hypothetical protein